MYDIRRFSLLNEGLQFYFLETFFFLLTSFFSDEHNASIVRLGSTKWTKSVTFYFVTESGPNCDNSVLLLALINTRWRNIVTDIRFGQIFTNLGTNYGTFKDQFCVQFYWVSILFILNCLWFVWFDGKLTQFRLNLPSVHDASARTDAAVLWKSVTSIVNHRTCRHAWLTHRAI